MSDNEFRWPENMYTAGKTKEDLLNGLPLAQTDPKLFEFQRTAIMVRCVQDLERRLEGQTKALGAVQQHLSFHMETLQHLTAAAQDIVEERMGELTQATVSAQQGLRQSVDALTQATVASSEGSARLGRQLVILNWILAIATAAGSLAGLATAYASLHH